MTLPDYISKSIHELAHRKEFVDYKLEFGAGSNPGDNYMGLMVSVRLTSNRTDKNGKAETETVNLLFKLAPSNPFRRQTYQLSSIFEREVQIYTQVLLAFVRFQEQKQLTVAESFRSFPNVYSALCDEANDQHVLIMEDLRTKNFKMYPKEKCIPLDHAKLVLHELGKYHAISFALKDQQPDLFEQLKREDVVVKMITKGNLGILMETTVDRTVEALVDVKHKQIMSNLKTTYIDLFEQWASDEFIGPHGVITHGDCWINNFLFQYKENLDYESPIAVSFVDWQLSRYGSPVLDFFHFVFSATNKTMRDNHYKDLMNVYHSSLSENIKKLGSDPGGLYTFFKFQDDLKKYGKYALLFGPLLAQLCIVEQGGVIDIDEYSERIASGEYCDVIIGFSEDKQPLFNKTVNDVVVDLINYGYMY